MERTARIVRIGSIAGVLVAASGIAALIGFAFGVAVLTGVAALVIVGSLGPLMLSFYELGGRTPLRLAQSAQALGWVSLIVFLMALVAEMSGLTNIDLSGPATGFSAVTAVALGYIGLWIAGANLLAGPWLTAERWLGLATGLAMALASAGALLGGPISDWINVIWIALLVLLLLWAFLMANRLHRLASSQIG